MTHGRLGERIRIAREAAGLSQTQLAVAIGLKHQQQVSTWEARNVIPSDRYRPKLAAVLGVDINEWVADEYQRRYEETAAELATAKKDTEQLAVMVVRAVDDFRSLADEIRALIGRLDLEGPPEE